ncbi:flagellar protein [Paenibacillus allorhizosphaerae]|uniref:Flagellar protein n=1 Tax=Paenibacillus allorhizosphaerae TaxID=2849866 RepID=A0ABM8VHH1_9BACL|nr:flagellar protein [Paenibacillus allorhizosphaerae]CAG7641859.1 hypothetical protein PAECIP111802_02787 [Paenibacillus allorhizosphaerae]
MTMLKVSNCPQCGKVYQNNLRNLCQECIRSYDGKLNDCLTHLRFNRKATTEQLAGAAGVSPQDIHIFIKDNRLPLISYPHITYPCNSCSAPIRQHHLCGDCRIRLVSEINKLKDQTEKHQQPERGIGFQIRERLTR